MRLLLGIRVPACNSALSGNHFEEELSERTARLCYLTALWYTLQPDGGKWPLLDQEHLVGRPHHQSRSRRESGLSHTLHPPLLCDTDEHWQHRALSCPFTLGDLVRVGSELDRQIAHIHGAAIPLQPEAHLLRPHKTFRQRIGPEIVPLLMYPVASFAHRPCLPPAECLSWLPSCCLGEAGKKAVDSGSVLDML